jgi:hypothetical protein
MDELEKNLPEDFWRKAFDEAAETPPPRVWTGIERRLDESDGPTILPLWGAGLASSRPFIWGTGLAAAVAVVLVGWWAIHTQTANQSVQQRSDAASTVAATKTAPTSPSALGKRLNQAGNKASVSVPEESFVALNQKTKRPNHRSFAAQSRPSLDVRIAQISPTHTADGYSSERALPVLSVAPVPFQRPGSFRTASSRATFASFTSTYQPTVANTASPSFEQEVAYMQLANKPMRFRKLGAIQRIVWLNPASWVGASEAVSEPEHNQKKKSTRDVWASASVMPGSFNPMVAVRSATPAFVNSLNYTAAADQSSVSSRANFSVAYQASAGVQLTDHWSIESGVGYLMGRSTIETPVQTPMIATIASLTTKGAGNLYVNALRNSSATVKAASYDNTISAANTQNYDAHNQQYLANNYQYVQVPVQVGYQLRPRKRLSLALLGGLITNIFVKNTVADEVVVTSKDGVYRPLSWSATLGARFRYRPSQQWSASLAGLYQPSLGLGTQTDSQVQTHPTAAGMSFGVDYHF